jgi:predicted nucleotidyltransferase
MTKLEETVSVLYDSEVEFVLIGGAAMGVQGSAHLTKDIAFCYERTAKNIEPLARALQPFHPPLRGAPAGLPFQFDAKTIAAGMNFTLTTDLGDVNFLGEVSGLGAYKEVLASSEKKSIGGIDCPVLNLDGLIKAKEAAARPRDLYVLPELRGLAGLKKKTGLE